jgi:hydroxyethylthiazole kinase-like uncharacterized protein yjeF
MRPILTAAEMRAAEDRAVAAGTPVEALMDRAGTAAAEAIRRYAGAAPVLVLCGPGNNGGDGYVVARRLREAGVPVRVAACGLPKAGAAVAAREAWGGPVEDIASASPAPTLVDALFGTGLTRGLDQSLAADLARLAAGARATVALDLPSGAATDDGTLLSPVPDCDLTVTFAALKPSHRLQPAARHMGRIVVADIGIAAGSRLNEVGRPRLPPPGPEDHKYTCGYLLVVGGAMKGASALSATAGLRAGAGYVALVDGAEGVPHAIVRRGAEELDDALGDPRVNSVLIGPGLGRSVEANDMIGRVARSGHPAVFDGDALWLIGETAPRRRRAGIVVTPHAGEFAHLFGDKGSKIEAARSAAARSGYTIVYKGADTVIAQADGRAAIAPPAPAWLATAGTGDVLSGIVAAMLACGLDAFDAACAAVWLHSRAAEIAGPGLIADDLLTALPAARAECR